MRVFTLLLVLVIVGGMTYSPVVVSATPSPEVTVTLPDETPMPTPLPPRMGKLGIGFSAGETTSMGILPTPMYGLFAFYGVSPAVVIGVHAGFISGSASGDGSEFSNVTTFNLAPYAQFYFGNRKDFSPYIKVALSYLSYSVTTENDFGKEETNDQSASSLWAAVGIRYNVSDSFGISGGMRFLDIGLSGDNKISAFGLATPSIAVDFTF